MQDQDGQNNNMGAEISSAQAGRKMKFRLLTRPEEDVDKLTKDLQERTQLLEWEKVTNEQVLERLGEKRAFLNNILRTKAIGSVIFWEEIASFVVPLKDRWWRWKEYEEEEHSSLMIWETDEDIES